MNFKKLESKWFEHGLPFDATKYRLHLQTVAYAKTEEGEKKYYSVEFYITDSIELLEMQSNGLDTSERGLPGLIMAIMIRGVDEDDSKARCYWTNLAEYGLSFILQRAFIDNDLETGFDDL